MTSAVFRYSSYATVPNAGDKFLNLTVDYANLLPLASKPVDLVKELNFLLTADQLSATTSTNISNAVSTIDENNIVGPTDSKHYLKRRIYAAMLLVLAAPEFIVSK